MDLRRSHGIWAIYEGLHKAWNIGYGRVMVESDKAELVHVSGKQIGDMNSELLIREISLLCSHSWEVRKSVSTISIVMQIVQLIFWRREVLIRSLLWFAMEIL